MTDSPLGLLVAGTRSGSGKTTLVLALLAALARRGFTVQACKTGPDFIDPTHHAALTGRPSYNLDSWMGGEAGMVRVFARAAHVSPADVLLVEGAMGLFDGARGTGGAGSSAHIARRLGLPVLLAADARGMGQSAAALAEGFLRHMPELSFAGVVCTHVGGRGHREMLREAFADARLPLLGLLPREGAPALASRHLGLLMAHEGALTADRCEAAADWLEAHLDLDALLGRLPRITPPAVSPGRVPAEADAASLPRRPRLGVARDAAFCFLYPDFTNVARELGLEPVFFSPLRDAAPPPDCAGLYFPGGYPELHAESLSANTELRAAVGAFAARSGLVYGECGGYMYLMDTLETQGTVWPMAGCLPLACRLEDSRSALGYREVSPAGPGPFLPPGHQGPAPAGRGHEYHYARVISRGTSDSRLRPLWHVRDRHGRPLPDEGALLGGTAGSWVHLYPEGARALLHNLAAALRGAVASRGTRP